MIEGNSTLFELSRQRRMLLSTPGSTPPLAASAESALRYAVQRLSRRLRRQIGDAVSPPHLAALSAIERHGRMRLGALARHEQIGKSSMTRLVARLEEDGLLTRVADAADRRGFVVELTESGRRALHEANVREDAYLGAQLAMLAESDRAAIMAAIPALERLLAIRA
jgi:DNA-binding MarR family transcriptional regulator